MKKSAILLFTTFAVLFVSCSPTVQKEGAGLENGEFNAELNGFNIHYAVHGSGPALFALPNSWGITHDGLRALYKPLEKYVTMVYFDPRGMGESDPIREDSDMSMAAVRTDLDALRQHLDLEKINVIGWSNGGQNLILFAAEYPETISKAIIVHANAYFYPEDMKYIVQRHPDLIEKFDTFQREMSSSEGTDEEMNAKFKNFVIDKWFEDLFADPVAGHEIVKKIYADVDFSWKHYQYSNTVDSPAYDARADLAKITCPTLVIAGAHDLMSPARVEEVSKGIANSTFVVFENSGHFSALEEPEKFKQTVLGFLGIDVD